MTLCRPTSSRAHSNGVHLAVCAVRAFRGKQRASASRSASRHAARGFAADRGPISAASLKHFFRGTLAPLCETSRAFAAVSAQVFASENRDLASQLASYNFLSEPLENTKAAEVAAGECFRLAGPTGLEPATSGVTGRRSNTFRLLALGRASRKSLRTEGSSIVSRANESANECGEF